MKIQKFNYVLQQKQIQPSFGAIGINFFQKKKEKSESDRLIYEAAEKISNTKTKDEFLKNQELIDEIEAEIQTKRKKVDLLPWYRRHEKLQNDLTKEEISRKEYIYSRQKENLSTQRQEIKKANEINANLKHDLSQINIADARLKEFEELQMLISKFKANKGFEKIAGYDEEKKVLYKYFISEISKDMIKQPATVPNAVLFFGPKGNGKTTFAKAFAQEIGCTAPKKDGILGASNKEIYTKALRKLQKQAENSKEEYEKNGKNSIILFDEFSNIANSKSIILPQLTNFLKDCYKKYHCIVFATTNYPLSIDLPVKGKDSVFPFVVSIDPPTLKTKAQVLKFYLNDRLQNASNEDYIDLAKTLEEKEFAEKKLYSNSYIRNQIAGLENNNKVALSKEDILKNIANTMPDISEEQIRNHVIAIDTLIGDAIDE